MNNILNKKQIYLIQIGDNSNQENQIKDKFENRIPEYSMEHASLQPYLRQHLCWTAEATKALIVLRGERDAEFELPGARKMDIWNEITVQMHKLGYNFNVEKISKKWHNIMITYKKNLEKKLRTGNVFWEFFHNIDVYFKDKRMAENGNNDLGDDDDDDEDDDDDYDEDDISIQKPLPFQTKSIIINNLSRKRTSSPPQQNQNNSYNVTDLNSTSQSSKSNDPLINNSKSSYKKVKYETSTEFPNSLNIPSDDGLSGLDEFNNIDDGWLKEYFQKKIEMDREKMLRDEQRHRDNINCQKAAIVLQERMEKIKVTAINNLTNAINKLAESKQQKR